MNDQSVPVRSRQTSPAARPNPGRNKKLTNGLVALSTAAVMAIYGVGYARTAPASNSLNTDPGPLAAMVAATATPTEAPATATTIPATSTATGAATTNSAAAARSAASSSSTSSTAPTATSTRIAIATATATSAAASSAAAYRDGTYTGTGTSRHGNIGVTVVVQGGKIVSAEITTCGTRYPCSKIADLPGEVVDSQSANVDFVSGSTDSSKAYKAAVQAALAKAV